MIGRNFSALRLDHRCGLGWRRADRREACLADAFGDIGQLERLRDRLRELVGNLRRGLRRRHHRKPVLVHHTGIDIAKRRDRRIVREPLGAGHGDELDLAFPDMPQDVARCVEHHVDMAAEQIVERRRKPRYGTCTKRTPAARDSFSIVRCGVLLTPGVAKVTLSGLALARAISSCRLETGKSLLAMRGTETGPAPTPERTAKGQTRASYRRAG